MRTLLFSLILQGVIGGLYAQSFEGIVLNPDNEPLPYASIYVTETGRGTVSGLDGSFKLDLPTGKSTLQIQYVGFQTIDEVIDFPATKRKTFVLPSVDVKLEQIQVFSSGENPGMAVMRKAIAKAPYHLNQIDGYSAKVYSKGTGKLDKIPRLLGGVMLEGGIDTSTVFISESISEVTYTRPGKFDERVISFKANGDPNVDPISFGMANFYEPDLMDGKISPLSPKAFRYYTFVLDSYFESNGKMVNKLEVIPKTKNIDLFEGYLYILDDYWSLLNLSVDFKAAIFDGTIDQTFTEVETGVYMPIQMSFAVEGKAMGFEFNVTYLSNVDEYAVDINPLLPPLKLVEKMEEEVEVAEDNVQKEPQRRNTKAPKLNIPTDVPVSIEDMKDILKDFEAVDTMEAEFVSEYSLTVDSNATEIDSLLWAKMRPVELTEKEERGYKVQDSLRIVNEEEKTEEELKLFNGNPLFNARVKLGDWDLAYRTPLLLTTYNLVEGFSLGGRLTINNDKINKNLSLKLDGRYGLAWNRFLPKAKLGYKTKKLELYVEGGRWMNQFSIDNPVLGLSNSISTLLFNRNFLWQYEKTFVDAKVAYNANYKYGVSVLTAFEERRAWRNFTDYTFFPDGRTKVNFDFNDFEQDFEDLDPVVRVKTRAFVRPWLKYRKYNNELRTVNRNTTALFELEYERALGGILDGSQTFDRLEGSVKYVLPITPFSRFKHKVVAGGFFDTPSTIENFQFFNGEEFLFTGQMQDYFRIASYYRDLPTDGNYLESYLTFSSDRLLLSRIPKLQLFGVSEDVFLNVLVLENREYYELGYGINWAGFIGLDFTVGKLEDNYTTGLRIKINGFEKIFE